MFCLKTTLIGRIFRSWTNVATVLAAAAAAAVRAACDELNNERSLLTKI
jgi:hypothetical protein